MSETVKNEVIKNRIDFVYFIDVKMEILMEIQMQAICQE